MEGSSRYDITYMGRRATELGFIRDTLEKVYRLADILEFLNKHPLLQESLALKGGTAINLTIFNLPRLSVDIDLDYMQNDSRKEMLAKREIVNSTIDGYMSSNGYSKSPKTKTPHSLDSWVYDYTNAAGNTDNIKIEINYSMRAHLFPAEERPVMTEHFSSEYNVRTLAAIEIFGSKINAMLSRAAARDLYDVGNLVKHALFDESEYDMLRKCVVFYAATSARRINTTFDTGAIDALTQQRIRTDLMPVLRKKDGFNLESAKKSVKGFIRDLMIRTESEGEFLTRFEKREYLPQLLFEQEKIVERVAMHPMALWKTT